MISARADSGPLGAIFACANCFYHFGQTACSHKSWGEARSKRILTSRFRNGYDAETPFEDGDVVAPLDEDKATGADTSVFDDNALDKVMNDSTLGTPLDLSSPPEGIEEAEPGRPYAMWPGENYLLCLWNMS
jgi:hypothetical protein